MTRRSMGLVFASCVIALVTAACGTGGGAGSSALAGTTPSSDAQSPNPTSPPASATSSATGTAPSASNASIVTGTTAPPTSRTISAPSTPPRSAPATGFPDATDTGAHGHLTPSGPVTVFTNGAVIQDLDVSGSITVQADNVTIRDVRVTTPDADSWGIDQTTGHTGLTIEDSEVRGGQIRANVGIEEDGSALTLLRVNVHGARHLVDITSGSIQDSYLHDPEQIAGQDDHVDLVHATPCAAGLTIEHSTLLNQLNQTSAINPRDPDACAPHDLTVTGNLLGGGGYTVYGGTTDANPHGTARIVITDNVFTRIFPNGGYYGPVTNFEVGGPGNTWSGNRWTDGGTIPPG